MRSPDLIASNVRSINSCRSIISWFVKLYCGLLIWHWTQLLNAAATDGQRQSVGKSPSVLNAAQELPTVAKSAQGARHYIDLSSMSGSVFDACTHRATCRRWERILLTRKNITGKETTDQIDVRDRWNLSQCLETSFLETRSPTEGKDSKHRDELDESHLDRWFTRLRKDRNTPQFRLLYTSLWWPHAIIFKQTKHVRMTGGLSPSQLVGAVEALMSLYG